MPSREISGGQTRKKSVELTPRYFVLMDKIKRERVRKWYKKQEARTEKRDNFLKIVGEAIKKIDYDYYIATIEPTFDRRSGKIFYEKGERVLTHCSCYDWEQMAKEFDPRRGSCLANVYELFLWYAYRIAEGNWTIDYVCDNSSREGNYCNSPKSMRDITVSGFEEVGGFADGVGNTYKIVKSNDAFAICGGNYHTYGNRYPVADVCLISQERAFEEIEAGVGCVILKIENVA